MIGDALDPVGVTAAAGGADVIVHAVNPPGYHDWAKVVLPMLGSTLVGSANSLGRAHQCLAQLGPDHAQPDQGGTRGQ